MKRRPLLAPLGLLIACSEHAAAPDLRPAPASVATLMLRGDPRPLGSVVTFSAKLNDASRRAGAYAARIEFDTTAVAYAGEGEATSGLVAFHAAGGVLKVAGASLDGYADGVLFHARFRVVRASSAEPIRLVIDELRDVGAVNRLPALAASRAALLRPWE
jgi:hypothetical protein